MDALSWAALALGGLVVLLIVVLAATVMAMRRQAEDAAAQVAALRSQVSRQSARHGQITEQFAPFVHDWPWDPKRFRFIGSPVDGIQFTDDAIVFVEIKTGRGQLTTAQRRVRDLVGSGTVAWHEVRLR